jgi:GntR family transcriptional repressor for pyruvate dehydrogenase complex
MGFKKVKRARIYEEVLAQLKDYLLQGNIIPGSKLPSERELARMFDVNRVSVREALTILEANGMITRKVGEGTFHTGASAYTASSIINLIQKNKNLIIEPLQVRLALEPKIARLAAANISKNQIAFLNHILEQQKKLLEKKGDISELDKKFHMEIALATGNSIFAGLVEALHNSFMESRYASPLSPERGKSGYLSHKKICAALKNRDSDKAEEALQDHLIQVERSAINYLKQKNTAS